MQDPDRYENIINESVELTELDERFKDTYIDIIKRFYNLFEQIYLFWSNLNQYLNDIQEEKYIEFTIDALI